MLPPSVIPPYISRKCARLGHVHNSARAPSQTRKGGSNRICTEGRSLEPFLRSPPTSRDGDHTNHPKGPRAGGSNRGGGNISDSNDPPLH